MKILLTGATGFVGSYLLSVLGANTTVLGRARPEKHSGPSFIADLEVGDIDPDVFQGIEVVIHCAARVHIMKGSSQDPLTEFQIVNTSGTLDLAKQAAAAGVKRFVFLSSIKVNGETTMARRFFSENENIDPCDAYAISKADAERQLLILAENTEMEVVIIRPPLVYGPNPTGNFLSLIKLIKKSYPLPLASITENKRSLIALESLVDFILLCADYNKAPQAANEIFVISDGEDVSTSELFHRVAKAYGIKSRLFPFPVRLLRLGAIFLGKQDIVDRLSGSLQVNSSKARELLCWKPVVTMSEQLKKMAEADR